MARRRNAARSIFHTAVGPERRVVDSPDIEPRIAMVPDEAWNWIEPAHVRKAAVQVPVDGRDRELAERETTILKAMAKATLTEQRELLAELNGIRAEKTARLAASRELDLANATVADHLTPIVSMGSRSTAKSDWLDDVPALTPGDMSHDMIVEAAMFWRNTHAAVKADVPELVEQAKGRARVVASRFEGQAPAARRIFMEEIVRLAAAHPAQEPAEDGVATSTLPVAINPSDAPETFDTNTLSDADREAIRDSQMADSDFAQKYQSSRVIAAINESMWAKLGGSSEDERDPAEEKWQKANDDTKDESADEDTSGDEKKKPFGKADDTDESDDSGGSETPVKGEVDDSAAKPWEKKDASRRTAAEEGADYRNLRTWRWKNDNGEYFAAADKDDNGPAYKHWEDGKYNPDCPYCWLGHPHTEKAHEAGIASYTRTSSKTAGAPTIMGPDQDLKNAPKAEQDAYWSWVGQMAADSDSGYYVPLSFKSWRSSYWNDEKGDTTYAPGLPPMASSRRKAAKIDELRQVVQSQQSNGEIDAFTASAITQIYDALGPEAQAKYAKIIESDLGKASDIAFKLINKNSSKTAASWDDLKPGDKIRVGFEENARDGIFVRIEGNSNPDVYGDQRFIVYKTSPDGPELKAGLTSYRGKEEEPRPAKESRRRTAADEPAKDGAAESTLPVAINPSDAPEGLDQLNDSPQPATGMVGEGSGPAPQGAAAGGPTTFNDFVKDHTKAAAFRARVQSNLQASRRPFGEGDGQRRTAVSLTNVGLDGENGIGTDPSGNRIRFRLSPQDRKDLSSVLFSDLAINFSGVDVDESDIIREAGRKTAMPNPVDLGVKVGDIFVSTWGYDQTNVDFYEVVGLTGASVKVRPIASQTHGTPTLWAQRDVMPVPGQYTGEVMTKRIQNYSDVPSFTLSSYSDAYLWDGKPVHETSYA